MVMPFRTMAVVQPKTPLPIMPYSLPVHQHILNVLPPGHYTLPKELAGHWYLYPFSDDVQHKHALFVLKLYDDGLAEYCRVAYEPSGAQIHRSIWCKNSWWRYRSTTHTICVYWVEYRLAGTFQLSDLPVGPEESYTLTATASPDPAYICDVSPAGQHPISRWTMRRRAYFKGDK